MAVGGTIGRGEEVAVPIPKDLKGNYALGTVAQLSYQQGRADQSLLYALLFRGGQVPQINDVPFHIVSPPVFNLPRISAEVNPIYELSENGSAVLSYSLYVLYSRYLSLNCSLVILIVPPLEKTLVIPLSVCYA